MSFAVTRMTVQEIPPFTLAFMRFVLASLLIWPLADLHSFFIFLPQPTEPPPSSAGA
jgi:drug/metabolite transporter (DMT)-like permease